MTLYDSNKLSLEDKQKVVWEQGVFLDNYITKDIRINCYAIEKFFYFYSEILQTFMRTIAKSRFSRLFAIT